MAANGHFRSVVADILAGLIGDGVAATAATEASEASDPAASSATKIRLTSLSLLICSPQFGRSATLLATSVVDV
jgi:hypothetical protein